MRVGVVGSRSFTDDRLMARVLSEYHQRRGIDAVVERNTLIVEDCDVLFVFYGPDGPTSGSNDSRDKALARRIPVAMWSQQP